MSQRLYQYVYSFIWLTQSEHIFIVVSQVHFCKHVLRSDVIFDFDKRKFLHCKQKWTIKIKYVIFIFIFCYVVLKGVYYVIDLAFISEIKSLMILLTIVITLKIISRNFLHIDISLKIQIIITFSRFIETKNLSFIIYFLALFDILCMKGHMFNKKYTKKFQMGNKCHHCIKVLFVIHVSAVTEAENG